MEDGVKDNENLALMTKQQKTTSFFFGSEFVHVWTD